MNIIKTTLKGALALSVAIAIALLIIRVTLLPVEVVMYLAFLFIGFSYLIGLLIELND